MFSLMISSCKKTIMEAEEPKLITLSTDRSEYHFSIEKSLRDTIWMTFKNTTDETVTHWFPSYLEFQMDTTWTDEIKNHWFPSDIVPQMDGNWIIMSTRDGAYPDSHVYPGQQMRTNTWYTDDTLAHNFPDGVYRIVAEYITEGSSRYRMVSTNPFLFSHW
jgi:hypothetical protein